MYDAGECAKCNFDCLHFLLPNVYFFPEGGSQEGDEADLVAHGVSKHLVTNKVLKRNYRSLLRNIISHSSSLEGLN